jgi:hypothetical protein
MNKRMQQIDANRIDSLKKNLATAKQFIIDLLQFIKDDHPDKWEEHRIDNTVGLPCNETCVICKAQTFVNSTN